jgi:hypothetical protein
MDDHSRLLVEAVEGGQPGSWISLAVQRQRVQEGLDQPDDVGLVDLDARTAHRDFDDRESDAIQRWKVHVHVEPLGLAGELVMIWNFSATA